jgi:thioredoxin reductase (NADPH)
MTEPLDCLVIGGGPAGLTAAIYLGRFRRRVTVIDKGWSRAEWITRSHNLPGFLEGIAGPALLVAMRAQARRYGAHLQIGAIEAVGRLTHQVFSARIHGADITAKTVLLATGVVENSPPLPHLAEAVKHGLIRTCPICDGYEALGKRVAVLGSGEHAAAEALFLRTYTDQLTLLLPAYGADALSESTCAALKRARVAVLHVSVGAVSLDDDGVIALAVEDGEIHHFDLAYSAFGTTAQSQLAGALAAETDEAGRLVVDAHQQTSIAGLYAAGDVVRGLNQICVADGEAAIAATAIHNGLPKPFA